MSDSEDILRTARQRMIRQDLAGRGINYPGLIEAFEAIPRELFIPPELRDQAYADHPIPIGKGQTISQPYIVAYMIQQLAPQPGQRVLDVGSGSGYQAAILSRLCGHVYGIERSEYLAERSIQTLCQLGITNATIRTGDGSLGLPDQAPFDRIICGAAAPDVPQQWIDQLAEGGRIVAPVGGQHVQELAIVEKLAGQIVRRPSCGVRFVRLIGRAAWPD
ncbi:MAG: protein-L-isoaspartate(D-aspartate) O-methyltransferase [Planctomycetes bacterium]|nr:protein-L-isoaspartate(D-aspartate) O-methyltransferase [Planctomycetota bacterium]